MRFENVCIESFGYVLPDEIVSSGEIEKKLEPVYQRLKLPAGRLELMTGIQNRRFFQRGTRPSQFSIQSCMNAINAADIDAKHIGSLIHGSVCRDFLEPATACGVHHQLNLSPHCVIYDVSNACLGILNGIVQAANMIELNQCKAALIVGTESGRSLVETTIEALNNDSSLTRQQIKYAVASLTIGSASCAVLLTHKDISQTLNKINGAVAYANTVHNALCHSDDDLAGSAMQPLMNTDSEALMREGIETGRRAFESFKKELQWDTSDVDKTFCHQVGGTHRKLMLEAMGIDHQRDFPTLHWLGNTGSAALPSTMAIGVESEFAVGGNKIAMLGIGSGINSVMIGVQWNKTLVKGTLESGENFDIHSHVNEPVPATN